jgi:hypothetical protein
MNEKDNSLMIDSTISVKTDKKDRDWVTITVDNNMVKQVRYAKRDRLS